MDQSPRLSLPYVMPAQAQKHVTVNETFRRLDALTQLSVRSQTVTAEPGAPSEGDAYILPSGASGAAWAAFTAGNVAAYQDGAWVEIAAVEGFRAWVSDAATLVAFDGAVWAQVSGGSTETAAKFGVNTTPDSTNKFAVKSNAIWFDALNAADSGTGDVQVKIDKEATADTGSVLYQTGASGRAEIGLIGDNDLHMKVSADGSSWLDAMLIKTNGDIGVNTLSPNGLLHVSIDGASINAILLSAGDQILLSGTNTAPSFSGVVAGSAASHRMVFKGVRTRGTLSSPSAVASNDITFSLLGTAYDGSDDLATAEIAFIVDAAVSTGTAPQKIDFKTGTSSRATRMSISSNGSVVVGSPTGGAKGLGTINAKAVYDDNSLLTCYVFDQALDGSVDTAKWDALVPDRVIPAVVEEIENPETGKLITRERTPERTEVRIHAPLRKFTARIGGEYDPLTLDGYARHWRDKRHLTAMPNETGFDPLAGLSTGEWVQRLVETVEVQAVLIEKLNQKVKALEGGRQARI